MKAWSFLVAGALASHGCAPEVPRESPTKAAPAAPVPPVTETLLAALVTYVPPEAVAVIAIDLAHARRSPPLARVVERLIAESGHLPSLQTARAVVLARLPGEPAATLLVIAGAGDEPELLGPPDALERSRAAHAGASATETGGLRDALMAVSAGLSGFAAIQMTPELQRMARGVLPDLGTATWFAATLDATAGVRVTVIAALPDLTTAVRIAAAADLGKSFGLGQLRTADPVAARAVEKVFARPVGSTLRVTATFDNAEALALLALLR